jgi:hypothetical protein
VAPNLQRFCWLIAKRKLIDKPRLEQLYRQWRTAEPDQRENLASFIRFLKKQAGVDAARLDALMNELSDVASSGADDEFEVELIPTRDPARSLDRRDVIMFIAGAVLGGVAVGLPVIVATRMSTPPPAATE